MTNKLRKFNKPNMKAERDKNGHRTGFPLMVKRKVRMSDEGWARWSTFSKRKIALHRFVYKTYHSTKQAGIPNGLPIYIMADEKLMVEKLIDTFCLQDGETYSFHSWTAGKTKTGCKLTKTLFELEIHNADKRTYTLKNSWRLNRYWFKKKSKGKENQNL
jgi:hypothetical protein